MFELSADCFCTVLEFCEGSDLDLVRNGVTYYVVQSQGLASGTENEQISSGKRRAFHHCPGITVVSAECLSPNLILSIIVQVVSALRYLNMQVIA